MSHSLLGYNEFNDKKSKRESIVGGTALLRYAILH